MSNKGHSGVNNAWLTSSTGDWNAIVQTVPVQPHSNYIVKARVRPKLIRVSGRLGVRKSDGISSLKETSFGAATQYTQGTLEFNSGVKSAVDLYLGFSAQEATRQHLAGSSQLAIANARENGSGESLQIDDVSIRTR